MANFGGCVGNFPYVYSLIWLRQSFELFCFLSSDETVYDS